MIKRILLPLDPSPYTDSATAYAIYIGKEHQAEITGLAVLDIPGIEKSERAVPLGGVYYAEHVIAHKQKDAQQRIEKLLHAFSERCEKEGVPYRLEKEQGGPVKRIVEFSLYYDLVVMGLRTNYHFETKEEPEKSVGDVLDRTITPILAVPSEFKPLENVTIAFDGSLPAARAMQRFAHLAFLPQMNVTLVHSSSDPETGKTILERAASYVRAYNPKSLATEWTEDDIEKAIELTYYPRSDMIVLGVNSKLGLLEFVLGTLPKKLINLGQVPLFLGS